MTKTEIEELIRPRDEHVKVYKVLAAVITLIALVAFSSTLLISDKQDLVKAILTAGGAFITAGIIPPAYKIADIKLQNKTIWKLQCLIEEKTVIWKGPPVNDEIKPELDELKKTQLDYFKK